MISKSLGSSFTTRIGPPIQIQKPKVTKVETLMRHEKAVLFHSFIHSLTHQIFREHPPCSKHLGYTRKWDHTLSNKLEGVSAIYKKQSAGGRGGAGSWGVVWCCAVLNWVVSMSLVEKNIWAKTWRKWRAGVCLTPELSYFSFQIQIYIFPWNPYNFYKSEQTFISTSVLSDSQHVLATQKQALSH